MLQRVKLAVLAAALVASPAAFAGDYPEKPIRLIAPFGQGGSTSNAARTMAKAIEDNDLLPVPIIISYVPGAAGTVGARQVKDAEPDGYSALIWHVAANGAQAMGNVDFGPDDFELVAGTDRKCYMIVVRETSEYQTLEELLTAAKENPDTIISADNLGGANHIAAVLAEGAVPGAGFRHVQFGGTAKTYPALLGGHAEVNASSTSALSSTTTKGLRVLGYMGAERHPDYPDVPTFKELGYDTEFCMYSWWFMPKGTPQERIAVLQDAMVKAMDTDFMREQTKAQGVEHVILVGDELQETMAREKKAIAAIGARLRDAD